MQYKIISIVIQARSTSTRFPEKIFQKIGYKSVLEHVIDSCQNAASYINSRSSGHGMICNVCLAVPYNDKIVDQFGKITIIEGPELDVLARYKIAMDSLRSDYIVRITSDCPFIPPFIISRAINIAIQDNLDYLSNVDEKYRTAPDGHDVEIISKKLLNWLNDYAKDQSDREHVTTLARREGPNWMLKGDIIGFIDLFKDENKISIDTMEDLIKLRKMYDKIYRAIKESPRSYRI